MTNIVLCMRRPMIGEQLQRMLRVSDDISTVLGPHAQGEVLAEKHQANVVLVEVAEQMPYDLSYGLVLCAQVKNILPACKCVLLCSEQDEDVVQGVVRAQRDGLIDDFLFYDCTPTYMMYKLKTV